MKKNQSSNHAVNGKTAYEASVIGRALDRAGNNPHLKGHIHEILTQDSHNLRNLFSGAKTQMTKSTTASTVDLVTTKGGKVVERLQLKDTVSKGAISKLTKQVANGKYHSAKLVGTEETTKLANQAFEKAGVAKKMVSSGHSTKTTTSLAQRAGASGSGSLTSAAQTAAKSGGLIGATVGAGTALVGGIRDYKNGTKTAGEVAGAVVKQGAKGGISGAASASAATVGGAAVATATAAAGITGAAAVALTVAAPVAIAVGVGYVVSSVFDAVFD